MTVQVVVRCGDDSHYLRSVRTSTGWHTEGLLANHPDTTPPRPWGEAGLCWAGAEHPVIANR